MERAAHGWELSNLKEDFTETCNLAASERERMIAMISLLCVEAGKYNVFPIASCTTLRFAIERPQVAPDRERYVYCAGAQMLPNIVAPRLLNRLRDISMEVGIPEAGAMPEAGADGVPFGMGGNDGGLLAYALDDVFACICN